MESSPGPRAQKTFWVERKIRAKYLTQYIFNIYNIIVHISLTTNNDDCLILLTFFEEGFVKKIMIL